MAIPFRRGWWKPWDWSTRTWLVAIFVCIVSAPFVSRWICLWQIPDVALPFIVEDVIPADVPKSENAYIGYATAIMKFRPRETSWSTKAVDEAIVAFDPKWDDRLDQWLIENRDVFEEFQRASEMEKACLTLLGTVNNFTLIQPVQNLRELAKISLAEMIRKNRSGEIEDAWESCRSILRAAHHAEIDRFPMARFQANVIRGFACQGIAHWAAAPSLTAERIRAARNDVAHEVAKRIPPSEIAKGDYLCIRNTLWHEQGPNFLLPNWDTSSSAEEQLLVLKRFVLWAQGQPELSLRLNRQLLANNAGEIDLPVHLRQPTLQSKKLLVFKLDPRVRRLRGQLDPAQLNARLDTSLSQLLLKQDLLSEMGLTDVRARLDGARLALIGLLLAAHEYQRTHGEFPASIEQLVPEFLDAVPSDPMDATGSPLRYRRDANSEAIVWSVGIDEKNDGGDIEGKLAKDTGYRLSVNTAVSPSP